MIRGGAFYDRRWPCCVGSVLRLYRLLILIDSRGVVQTGLGILDTWVANHWRRPSSASWHRTAPREYPSIGLLCEADLTKPDIIETAAGDPFRTLSASACFSKFIRLDISGTGH